MNGRKGHEMYLMFVHIYVVDNLKLSLWIRGFQLYIETGQPFSSDFDELRHVSHTGEAHCKSSDFLWDLLTVRA